MLLALAAADEGGTFIAGGGGALRGVCVCFIYDDEVRKLANLGTYFKKLVVFTSVHNYLCFLTWYYSQRQNPSPCLLHFFATRRLFTLHGTTYLCFSLDVAFM